MVRKTRRGPPPSPPPQPAMPTAGVAKAAATAAVPAASARRKMRRRPPPLPPPQPAMPNPGVAKSAAASSRRQPVILQQPSRPSAKFAEVAGGTTADCATMCCCCPCVVVDFVVLTAVRLPAGLCRRALRSRGKRKETGRNRKEAALLGSKTGDGSSTVVSEEDLDGEQKALHKPASEAGPSRAEIAEVEKVMCTKFRGTGFWRSPSQ